MNSDSTRRYTQPVPVSPATALHYRQHRNSSSVASSLGSIPDPTDLLNIKADLEALLPVSEKRVRNLQRDLSYLKKNIKPRELTEEESQTLQKKQQQQQLQIQQQQLQQQQQQLLQQQQLQQRKGGAGKSTSPALLEKMQIKQETDESSDNLLSTPHNKNQQMDRQLALEALRRKRRRDDDTTSKISSRSESPHHIVKLKRLDDTNANTRSLSPPPPSSKSHSKSGQTHTKKKKSEAPRHSNKQSQNVKNRSSNSNHVNDEVDFVRVKAKDQVPILNFWAVVDPHFKPLAEEDREFLLEKHDDEKYYIIPPLGRHYTDIWSEDDLPAMSRSHSPATSASSRQGSHDHLRYLSSYDQITDDHLFKDDISCGHLTERLLSSLVPDETSGDHAIAIANTEDEDDLFNTLPDEPVGKHYNRSIEEMSSIPPDDIIQFEERLKSELRYAGLFGEDDMDWNSREDDEICAELRLTQRELKEQYTTNEYKKKKLLEVVDNQLQYEQYRQVLDNLDVQVEQCYLKRFRTQKSKKRKTPASQKSALSEHAVHAMGKRKAWVDALEGIFKDKNLVMPSHSIYDDEKEPTTASTTAVTEQGEAES